MVTASLRPFWRYYGAKWRIAPRYPKPRHRTIIEPFAGAAGYSLRYPGHDVILVEKYHVIAEIWRWLIAASPDEVRAIPCVDAIADLPAWVPDGARWLVGFLMNSGTVSPCKVLSAGARRMNATGTRHYGWSNEQRERVALQVTHIKHWHIIEGDYSAAPDIEATWFVDPPYSGRPGSLYVHPSSQIDYPALAGWCRGRCGQVVACEALGAAWLPFSPFGATRGMGASSSSEAIWWSDSARSQGLLPLESTC